MKNLKKDSNMTFNRRKAQIESLKPKHPSNNGWWYYDFFKGSLAGGKLNKR
tara:strand:+ start:7957 stop:8109 length:153 start_codon:yes stop_codon:yes gene_type:complete